MDSIFSVADEVDFSDDDLQFNTFQKKENPPDTDQQVSLPVQNNLTELPQIPDVSNIRGSSRRYLPLPFNNIPDKVSCLRELSSVNDASSHIANRTVCVSTDKRSNINIPVNEKKKRKRLEDKPCRPSSRQRRFPGPAGLLPSLNKLKEFEKLKSPEQCRGKRTLTPLTPKTPVETFLFGLSQDEDFTHNIWRSIQKETFRLFPKTNCETISSILKKATFNQLNNGKITLFCGLLKSFTMSGCGGKVVLKDPTGEINGTVHQRVVDEHEANLVQGSGLLLKEISVFSPSAKKHYLNITPSNIVQIFPAEVSDIMPTQTQVCFQPDIVAMENTESVHLEKVNMLVCDTPVNACITPDSLDIFVTNDDFEDFFEDDFQL